MVTRSGDDHPPELTEPFATAQTTDWEEVSTGRFPVADVANS
ncbi:MAG TPA: hypothetical protein VIS09_27410 [Streptomyces sp.]